MRLSELARTAPMVPILFKSPTERRSRSSCSTCVRCVKFVVSVRYLKYTDRNKMAAELRLGDIVVGQFWS